jgi:hypothetical protein
MEQWRKELNEALQQGLDKDSDEEFEQALVQDMFQHALGESSCPPEKRYLVSHCSCDLIGVLSTYPSHLHLLFCFLQLFQGDAAMELRELLLASELEELGQVGIIGHSK